MNSYVIILYSPIAQLYGFAGENLSEFSRKIRTISRASGLSRPGEEGCNTAAWSWTISVGPRGWETQPSVNIIMKLEQEQMVQSYERTHATSSQLSSWNFPPVAPPGSRENKKYQFRQNYAGKISKYYFLSQQFSSIRRKVEFTENSTKYSSQMGGRWKVGGDWCLCWPWPPPWQMRPTTRWAGCLGRCVSLCGLIST